VTKQVGVQAMVGYKSVTGYMHPSYADSLAVVEFGTPIKLNKSGGWILKRPILGSNKFDGMGCYPVFSCKDWSKLIIDLEDMENEIICLSIVTDPFGNYNLNELKECFKDKFLLFKEHFVMDLKKSPETCVSSHHQRNSRKALRLVNIEKHENPIAIIDDWLKLYQNLIERHNIRGIARFSKQSFEKQLSVPGMVCFRALHEGITVGITLWYVCHNIGYYHLGAYSDLGYELRASFAIFWSAISYFAESGLSWMSLGAGAGANGNASDGLSRFKRGWANSSRPVYLCGRIFNHDAYSKLAIAKGVSLDSYFPAYRKGEFN
jgi:hypothetical protein